jgi:iron complex outermembrane recepter protein
MKINQNKLFLKNQLSRWITLASIGALAGVSLPVLAADEEVETDEIVVTGQRASIQSAQTIKRDASTIVDSIVAEDIGKLPDRSITEALQRVPGVSVTRYDSLSDPEHFAGEGSGVAIRGLTQVLGQLNGRDLFSADGGRTLSFEDVPAELMAGVDVHKSPSADMIEGGLGGIVNLRTRMPFDSDDQVISGAIRTNYGDLIEEYNGEYSALYSNRWNTDFGDLGFLVSLASSDLSTRADNIYNRAFFPRTDIESGETVWVPRGSDWRRNDYHRNREGLYAALQWAPNDNLETYLTAFTSEHDSRWDENGFFVDAGGGLGEFLPVKGADDWVYDSRGVLTSGTITTTAPDNPANTEGNGVPFGTSTRYSANKSITTDYSTGVKWTPDDRWTFNAELQYVKAKSDGEDYTLGLVAYPDEIKVSNLNGVPSIYVDPEFLSDYSNYSWGQMMAILSDNDAESLAARVDAEYDFEDSIIKSVKAGVRFTDKSAENRGANQWQARYQPWQVGQSWQPFNDTSEIPKISDAGALGLTLFSYDNFARGDAKVPTTAYLASASLLQNFRASTDAITAATPGGCCGFNWSNMDLSLSGNRNLQDENTSAVYVVTNFGFDDWAVPLDGNLGVRYVKTENTAHGNVSYPTFTLPDESQPFYQPPTPIEVENSYDHVLPSLNLRLHVTDDLLIRFAAAKAIWRPEFWRMKANWNFSAGFKDNITPTNDWTIDQIQFSLDSGGTNPLLEPMESNQLDLSAEWYFDDNGGMAHINLFTKDVKDYFRTQTDVVYADGFPDVKVTWPVNTGSADIDGVEVGFTKFFDSLPSPFDGLGLSVNYTYIDSSTAMDPSTAPVNTDGTTVQTDATPSDAFTYDDLPFEGLSKDSFNVVAMYEKEGWSARLAYTWRSEYLVAVGPNGWNGSNNNINWRLPVYNDDYGQMDASLSYKINENFSVYMDVYNLTQEVTKGLIDQGDAGMQNAYFYSQDTRYTAGLRVSF